MGLFFNERLFCGKLRKFLRTFAELPNLHCGIYFGSLIVSISKGNKNNKVIFDWKEPRNIIINEERELLHQ